MNDRLYVRYACPRDKTELTCRRDQLCCTLGHRYPIVRGVPVFLLPEAESTHNAIQDSIARAQNPDQPFPEDEWHPTSHESVHPAVQKMVSAAGGYLYESLIGKLRTYPIPEIRLDAGNGRQLLDIGCNWGRWTISAARKGYFVTGMDPDLGAVFTARRVAEQLGVRARFIVGDARWLPFPNNSFQVAFSYSVLQHFSKSDAALAFAEIGRVLEHDGKALIQLPNKFGIRSLYHQVRLRSNRSKFRVRYWSPKEILETFTRLVGPSSLSVDGFFGLGIQAGDINLLPLHLRSVVISSEVLRRASERVPALKSLADSLYVTTVKP